MKKLYTLILALGIIGVLGAGALLLAPGPPQRDYVGAASSALVNDLDDLFAKTEGVIPITRYGASTSASAATNTTAIHNAIADMTAGMTLYVPPGNFNVTNVLFNAPNYCNLKMDGAFIGTTAGVTLTIGGPSGVSREHYNCNGIHVRRSAISWAAGDIGVKVTNLYYSKLSFNYVKYYEAGLALAADGATGNTYNVFYGGYFHQNRYAIMYPTLAGGAWVGELSFYSPTLRVDGAPGGFTVSDATLLYEQDITIGKVRYYSPCFEGALGLNVATLSGSNSTIFYPRTEIVGVTSANGIALAATAYNWTIYLSDYYDAPIVTDAGRFNKILHGNQWSLEFNDLQGPGLVVNSNNSGATDPATHAILSVRHRDVPRFLALRDGGIETQKVRLGTPVTSEVPVPSIPEIVGQATSPVFGVSAPSSGSGIASGLGSVYVRSKADLFCEDWEGGVYHVRSGSETPYWASGAHDTGSVDTWTNHGVAGPTGGGTYGVKFDAGEYGLLAGTYGAEVWVSALVRSGSDTGVRTRFLMGTKTTPYWFFYLAFGDTGLANPPKIYYTDGTNSFLGVTTYTADTWYRIKIRLVKDASAGIVQVWMNDVLEIDQGGLNTTAGVLDYAWIGTNSGSSQTFYADHFRVSSSDPDISGGMLYVKTGMLSTNWTELAQRHTGQVLLGTVGATGDHFVYHADKKVVVEKITLVSDAGVAASDTDYFSFQVRNLTAAKNLLSAAQTTKVTGGTAIVADTAWDITPNQNATLAAGAIIELQVTKTLAPADLTRCTIFVHVRAAE